MNWKIAVLVGLILWMARAGYGGQAAKDVFACEPDPYRVVSLVGMVSVGLGTNDVVNKVMPCLVKLWDSPAVKNDGDELPSDISNAFLAIMEENPPLFFSIMSQNRQVFKEWLGQLPDNSFTWDRSPPCGLEQKREQLISLLKISDLNDPKLNSLKEQVVQRLASTRCRQIE